MSGAGRQPLHDPCCWYNLGGLAQEGPCVDSYTAARHGPRFIITPDLCEMIAKGSCEGCEGLGDWYSQRGCTFAISTHSSDCSAMLC